VGHARWGKYEDVADRLRELARKADLMAWALQGVMALEDNDAAWPIQDVVYEIKNALEAIPLMTQSSHLSTFGWAASAAIER
jgi:hypothetical protein